MKHKLNSKLEHEQAQEEQAQSQAARQFSTPEELLRFDAAQTGVPETVASRLQQSIGAAPVPIRSWWQRLFGKTR